MGSSKTVSEHFVCAPEIVWKVLTDASSYGRWFGWPESLELLEVEPGFVLGGKLNFRNSSSTLVITKLEDKQRIAFTGLYQTDEIVVRGAENGCRVSISTTYQTVDPSMEDFSFETVNRNILKNLRKTCYAFMNEEFKQAPERTTNVRDILFRVTRGYTPTKSNAAVEDPYTERNLYISTRNKILGLLLIGVLLAVISVGLSFERSDIVPSSGLSVAESKYVTFENALQIAVGQKKSQVELLLSCIGEKQSVDEFSYSSTEKMADGRALWEIRVVYDAYGLVRRFGYIDHSVAEGYGVKIRNVGMLISPSMDVGEAAEELGAPVSAFWVDKSGTKYLYYGHYLFENNLFESNKTAELVVRLNEEAIQTQVGYYLAESPEDPLRMRELQPATKHQYSSLVQYDTDRAVYRRVYLLPGKTKHQVDILLGMADEVAETELENGNKQYTYLCGKGSDGYRYSYTVEFSGKNAVSASMRNHHLGVVKDTLKDLNSYFLPKANTLYEVSEELLILPTYAGITGEGEIILGYGLESPATPDADPELPYDYPLIIILGTDHRVSQVIRNTNESKETNGSGT